MKKLITTFASFFLLAISGVFATEIKITPHVLSSFQKEFSRAEEVTWYAGANYYQAAFNLNGQNLFAYFSTEGELLTTARYLSPLHLPIQLLTELKNDFSQYWVSDLFEISSREGTRYYITLENAETSLMLVSRNGIRWKQHSKKAKI